MTKIEYGNIIQELIEQGLCYANGDPCPFGKIDSEDLIKLLKKHLLKTER